MVTFAATRVTSAPRRAASSASARPMRPGRAVADVADRVDRLAGAAGGHEHAQAVERRARRPCRAGPRRSPGFARGSASRPTPHSPLRGERPVCRARRSRRRGRAAASRFAWVAGCSYMWLFIAGASTSGAVQASAALVSRLSASPARAWRACSPRRARRRTRRRARTSSRCEIGSCVGRRLAGVGAAGRVALELVDEHGGAGDALEGRPADEAQARRRLDHPHGVARAGREADQLDCLVRGDPAGYAEQDPRQVRLPSGSGT